MPAHDDGTIGFIVRARGQLRAAKGRRGIYYSQY